MPATERLLTVEQARRYLVRLVGEHAGGVMLASGLLLLALGASVVGAIVLVGGAVLFAASVLSASVEAVRMRRRDEPWFGPNSTAAETNRLTGWWYLDEAATLVGRRPEQLRALLRASVALALAALGLAFVVAAVRA